MALITDAALSWSAPVTLTSDEIWQTRRGSALVSTNAAPGAEDGLALQEGSAVQFSAGVSVRYRKEGHADAWISREAV